MQNVTGTAMSLPQLTGVNPALAATTAAQPVTVMPQAGVQSTGMDPMTYAQLAMNPQLAAAYGISPTAGVMPNTAAAAGYPMAAYPGATANMAGAQAVLGATASEPPSTLSTVLKSTLAFGGLGAALGAGAGLIVPFFGPITGAIVGGVGGALLGAIRGVRNAKRAQEEYRMMMQSAPADPTAEVPVNVAPSPAKKKKKVQKKVSHAKTYTVHSGDTLSKIAAKHKTTVKKLHDLNRSAIGPDPSKLKVGVKLKLPS